ncbi:hypothetical protein ANCCAN_00532 [Ancylostoma caninum]|uniref:Uncharacterized protein n=1 Tax=Ancylostoma caninum TaxID=29170 RepID=A0A368HA98_ANCCA|nr:hypothetical protein ANCCAN_00532 [Ancylostoma caninum]
MPFAPSARLHSLEFSGCVSTTNSRWIGRLSLSGIRSICGRTSTSSSFYSRWLFFKQFSSCSLWLEELSWRRSATVWSSSPSEPYLLLFISFHTIPR